MNAQEENFSRGQQTGGAARQARPAGLTVRPLEERDLAEAAAIEATAPDAWSEAALRAGLAGRQGGGAARLFAAEWGGGLDAQPPAPEPGSGAARAGESAERAQGGALPSRPCLAGVAAFQLAAGEASLDTLTIPPDFRRRGVGRALLSAALAQLCAEGAAVCFLEVREGNAPAIALYKSLGFAAVGRRRNFYRGPDEDALVMRCVLPVAPG